MKIVETNKAYYPKVGGIETTVKTLSEGLVNRYNSEVEVLVCNHKFSLKNIEETINGVKVKYLLTYGLVFSLPLSPGYPKSLLELKGDILHIHEPFPLADLTLELIPNLRKNFSKIVTTWHCDITRQKWALPIYGKYIRKFLKTVDRIIVSNPFLINNSEFLSDYKSKCVVIPIGIDLEWAKKNENEYSGSNGDKKNEEDVKILFVGRLVIYKGVNILIEAMKYLDYGTLTIIGSGPLEKYLKNKISQLNLESRVKIIPEVSETKLHEFYKSCDIFVLPSINKTEAYGIVQIEAMACGKPIVCTELGTGTSYINQDNVTGFVVPPGDPNALAGAINVLQKDKELRQRFGKNGIVRAFEEFTSEKMISRTYKLFEDLLTDDK